MYGFTRRKDYYDEKGNRVWTCPDEYGHCENKSNEKKIVSKNEFLFAALNYLNRQPPKYMYKRMVWGLLYATSFKFRLMCKESPEEVFEALYEAVGNYYTTMSQVVG